MAKVKIDPIAMLKQKTVDLKPTVYAHEVRVKSNIIILPELRDLIPPLTDEESNQLKENIDKYGIKDPLSVWETTVISVLEGLEAGSESHELFVDYDNDAVVHILVDGHNRYKYANAGEKVLDYRINLLEFENLKEVREYMIDYQLGRRNLKPEQISYLRGLKYNKLKASNKSERINVADDLAEEFGVSSRTIKRDGEFAKGIEKLTPGLKEKVLSGEEKLPKEAVYELSKVDVSEKLDTVEKVAEVLPKKKNKIDKLIHDEISEDSDDKTLSLFNTENDIDNNEDQEANLENAMNEFLAAPDIIDENSSISNFNTAETSTPDDVLKESAPEKPETEESTEIEKVVEQTNQAQKNDEDIIAPDMSGMGEPDEKPNFEARLKRLLFADLSKKEVVEEILEVSQKLLMCFK